MISDSILAEIAESERSDVKQIIATLTARHGHEWVNIQMLLAAGGEEVANPFGRGFMRAADLPAAEEPVRLWFGLYPRSVALLIGETGAGKSSLLYNLAIHAARNEPLWDVPFGMTRPLKVLYVDPENSGNYDEGRGGQCSVKIERIAQGRPVELVFHDGQGVNLSNALHISALHDVIEAQNIDLCVLDPIANLFATKDENDNAEASRQMAMLTQLSRSTGACLLAVHHTGKDAGGNYGRGASARLGAADVAMVFRAKSENEEQDDTYNGELIQRTDECRLQIVKNRIEGRGSLYLRMGGEDRFLRSSFDSWRQARNRADADRSKASSAEEELRLYLSDGLWHTRSEIVEAMKREDIGRNLVDTALEALELSDTIISKRAGRGGPLQFILASSIKPEGTDPKFPGFPVSLGDRETGKLPNEGNQPLDRFFDQAQEDDWK